MRDSQTLLLIGQPGCGKGTQSRMLTQALGVPALSTGDLLRAEVARHTPLGAEIESRLAQGQLVDDELIDRLLRQRLKQSDCARGFILDGYPRTVPQAHHLEEVLKQLSLPRPAVLYFEGDEQAIVDRLCARRACPSCGFIYNLLFQKPTQDGLCDHDGASLYHRSDDRYETVTARMQVFHRQTAPLLRHYLADASYQLHRIDTAGNPAQVFGRIQECLSRTLVTVAA